jgi:hypothetical protein
MLSFLLISSKYDSKAIYITAIWILSNTDLDEKTELLKLRLANKSTRIPNTTIILSNI